MEQKFYRCEMCGNIITHLNDSGVRVVCCGQEMGELVAKTADSTTEKHVPVVKQDGRKVNVVVGSVDHPMTEEHWIQWICLVTKEGCEVKYLNPGDDPAAEFTLSDSDEIVAVYEYCNLHSLWVA
ncbi:MAG TPA: desulfoferrodoxin [Clostridiales bacterium]|jgi:superoxide reductase|nr:desulfoferrodoxin [Clostridiales bacterium]